MRYIRVGSDLVEADAVIPDNMLLDHPSYPRNVDRTWTSSSWLLFDVPKLLELPDGAREHHQAFRNALRSDAANERVKSWAMAEQLGLIFIADVN